MNTLNRKCINSADCEPRDIGPVGDGPRGDGLRDEQHGGARGRRADRGERNLGREGGGHGFETR